MERSKLDTRQKVQTEQPKLDVGGGGGNNGKSIFNGGGGGDDGSDDDDEYNFEDGDGDDSTDAFFRKVIGQLYTPEAINAVLQEWFRTIGDLPAIIRQSVQLGLFSSAQLVRFLSMDVRPNVTRAVTRTLPPSVSRGVVGRLMADPAFVQKMLIEVGIVTSGSLLWELQQRGERFSKELDFVAVNTLAAGASAAALVWLTAPNRSYGAVHKMPWQNMLHNMPNNLFDASTPLRTYSNSNRAAGLLVKTAELAAAGSITGAAQWGLSQLALMARRRSNPNFQPAVTIPSLQASSGGLATYMALWANARFQLVSGADRYMFDHYNQLWAYLTMSGLVRFGSNLFLENRRRVLQQITAVNTRQLRLGNLSWQQLQMQKPAAAPVRNSSKASSKTGKKRVKKVKRSSNSSGGRSLEAAGTYAPA